MLNPEYEDPNVVGTDAFIAVVSTSVGLLMICTLALAFMCWRNRRLRRALNTSFSRTVERSHADHSALCSALIDPPLCDWELGVGRRYAIFLSHYKMEAGVAARYLHDLLQKMVIQPVFLDSAALVNLQALFTHGVRSSDTLVLVMTAHVLERPWCLMEVWEAIYNKIPVAVLWLMPYRRSKGLEEAKVFLSDLVANMEKAQPGAGTALVSKLPQLSGAPSVEEMQAQLLRVIQTSRPVAFDPMGTDFDMLASARTLINELARLKGRQLQWREANRRLPIAERSTATASFAELSSSPRDASTSFVATDASVGYAETAKQLSAMLYRRQDPDKPYTFFICYNRAESAAEARRIKLWLVKMTGCAVFLDVDEQVGINDILQRGVVRSQVLLLLQTKNVLSRPWVLAEVYMAAKHGMPIVPVLIDHDDDDAGRYDFVESRVFLDNLWRELEIANAGAGRELRRALCLESGSPQRQNAVRSFAKRFTPFRDSGSPLKPKHEQSSFQSSMQMIARLTSLSRTGSQPQLQLSTRRSSRPKHPPPRDGRPSHVLSARPSDASTSLASGMGRSAEQLTEEGSLAAQQSRACERDRHLPGCALELEDRRCFPSIVNRCSSPASPTAVRVSDTRSLKASSRASDQPDEGRHPSARSPSEKQVSGSGRHNSGGKFERRSSDETKVQQTVRELIPNLITRCKYRADAEDQMVALVSEIVHTADKLSHMMMHPYVTPEETLDMQAKAAARAAHAAATAADAARSATAATRESSVAKRRSGGSFRSRLTHVVSMRTNSTATTASATSSLSSASSGARHTVASSVGSAMWDDESTIIRIRPNPPTHLNVVAEADAGSERSSLAQPSSAAA